MGMWPEVPCPPGRTEYTAAQRLKQIQAIAQQEMPPRVDVIQLAERCRTRHAPGPNHQEENSDAVSRMVASAHGHATANPPDWGACAEQLAHEP